MRVAVTGGTGFVGAHSARALLDAGHDLRFLVRSRRTLGPLAALGIHPADSDLVEGDICDSAAVDRLLNGSDALLHTAGVVGVDDRDESSMWRVNVRASTSLMSRAVDRGLDPIVYVSSYSAVFPSGDAVIGPDSPTSTGARTAYGRTKSAADHFVRGLQAGGAPIVVTYPSSIVGPPAGDRCGMTADGWAPLLRAGLAVTVEGAVPMIDVRDLAAVHAAVMEPGRGPRRYMCGGEMVRFNDVIDTLERASKRHLRRIPLTPGILRIAGRVFDMAARVTSFPPVFSYEAAWLLTSSQATDDSRTQSELGVTWRSVQQSLEESVTGA